MTDAQAKFLELSTKYEALKDEMKAMKPQIQELLTEIGVDTIFQDPTTKLVYKVEIPKGTFISFDPIGYKRTKKYEAIHGVEESSSGKLAKKEAQAAGFEL